MQFITFVSGNRAIVNCTIRGEQRESNCAIVDRTISSAKLDSRFYDISTLLDVLRGSESRAILSGKLNELEVYGKLTDVSREDLAFIVDWLIENGYILKTKSRNPVLHHTGKGISYQTSMTVKQLKRLKSELENQWQPKADQQEKDNT